MRTSIILFVLIFWNLGFGQVPSINQAKVWTDTPSSTRTEAFLTLQNIAPITDTVAQIKKTVGAISIERTKKVDAALRQEIENKNKEIQELNDAIVNQNTAIAAQNQKIAEQNAEIEIQKKQVKGQNEKIAELNDELFDDELHDVDAYVKAHDKAIAKKRKEIRTAQIELAGKETPAEMNKTRNQIDSLKTQLKSLIHQKAQDVKMMSYRWWLPSVNEDKRSYFFKTMYNSKDSKTKFLNAFGISATDYGISGQSELITDNISFLRIAFGTVITASNDDDEVAPEDETAVEALDRLVNGGGNFYIETILPLATTVDKNNSDLITAYSYLSLRAATDIKGYGNDIDTSTGNGSGGLYLYLGFSSESRKFNFFFQGNANFTMGSTAFYENLNINHNNGFFNGKMIAGLTLENKFRFTANFFTFGSESSLRREKIALGFQFLP